MSEIDNAWKRLCDAAYTLTRAVERELEDEELLRAGDETMMRGAVDGLRNAALHFALTEVQSQIKKGDLK